MAYKEKQEHYKGVPKDQRTLQGTPDKPKRLGIPQKCMQQAQAIAKHPEIVEKVTFR